VSKVTDNSADFPDGISSVDNDIFMHPQDTLTRSIYKVFPPSFVKIKLWLGFAFASTCPKSHSSSEITSCGGSADLLAKLLIIKYAHIAITIPVKIKKIFS
jgi:hypothetical protein